MTKPQDLEAARYRAAQTDPALKAEIIREILAARKARDADRAARDARIAAERTADKAAMDALA